MSHPNGPTLPMVSLLAGLPMGALAVVVETGTTHLNARASELLGPVPGREGTPFSTLFGKGSLGHLLGSIGDGPALLRCHHPNRTAALVALEPGPMEHVLLCTVTPWSLASPSAEGLSHVISHDLREPYRMVHAFTDLVASDVDTTLSETGERHLGFLRGAIDRLGQQLGALTEYSRVETRGRSFSAVDLRSALDTAFDRVGPVPPDVDLDVQPKSGSVIVLGDAPQLAVALRALIDNAIKFRAPEAPRISISAHGPPGKVTITVTDNGIGIPEGDHERMFKMFQQRHPREEFSGIGLGLPLARHIAHRHGGACWLTSAPTGPGTRAHLTLHPAFGDDG